jgi:hypothetical protein
MLELVKHEEFSEFSRSIIQWEDRSDLKGAALTSALFQFKVPVPHPKIKLEQCTSVVPEFESGNNSTARWRKG